VLHFTQKAPPEKPVDYEAIVLQASTNLAWARRVAVKDAQVMVSLASMEVNLEISIWPSRREMKKAERRFPSAALNWRSRIRAAPSA